MTHRILTLLAVAACLSSCDKAKQLAHDAKNAVKDMADGSAGGKESIAPEWASLIDRNEEGILFRRDLPFPENVSVAVRDRETLAVRLILSSEIGRHNSGISAIRNVSFDIDRKPGSLRFSNYAEEYHDTVRRTEKDGPVIISNHPLLPPSKPKDHTMVLRDSKWTTPANPGFSEILLAQQLGPVMNDVIHEYALGPRPMWFGQRRITPGKPIEISGELLPMLVAGKATGALTITLEDIEPVHGHPCGRFAIKGGYQRKNFPLVDGRLFHEECTIQSGHVWLSVIHPLVLRSKLERIVTFSIAEGSGPTMRYQGSSSPERTITWKPGDRDD